MMDEPILHRMTSCLLQVNITYLSLRLSLYSHICMSCPQACAALGAIFSAQGNHERAVSYFEKTFEVARSVGDRKLVDSARINLGMARGNMGMSNYMDVVNGDLPALLKWKTRRVTFK